MPKVNLLEAKKKRWKPMCTLLLGAKDYEKIPTSLLAEKLDISEPTVIKYMREPDTAPLGKLMILRRALNIPIEDFRNAVPD